MVATCLEWVQTKPYMVLDAHFSVCFYPVFTCYETSTLPAIITDLEELQHRNFLYSVVGEHHKECTREVRRTEMVLFESGALFVVF